MPMAAALPVNLSGGEEGAEDDDEKERFDAEVRHLSDDALREKKRRTETMINNGTAGRLSDGGKKLRGTIDSICRELDRRKLLSEAPHTNGGGREARAQDEKGSERIVRSRGAQSSGKARDSNNGKVTKSDFLFAWRMDAKADVDRSSLDITSGRRGKPNASVKNEGKYCQEKKSPKSSSQLKNLTQEESYVDDSDSEEKISSDDSPNCNYQTCTPALTRSRKRKGDNLVGFSMRLRSKKEEVVLLDGDTPHAESAEETSKRSAEKLYYPSREHPNSVEISSDDMKCLEPESLLSSPIVNFYIMYLQGRTSSTVRPRGEYHIFNTYFFSKLEALTSKEDKTSYFLKLRRWWRGVDLFQKAYILLPVHADAHWSLVIICMPDKDDPAGPIILHLDSLKFHRSKLIFDVVSRFLKEEWCYVNENASLTEIPLHKIVWKSLPRKIEKKSLEVPQQENDYDCGVFVLYYMQYFLKVAPKRLQKKDLSMFGKRWFQPEEPSQLRQKIRHLIRSHGEAEPKDDATEPSCGEAEPKDDSTEPSRGEAEAKGDATESCMEAEPRNGTTAPSSCREAAETAEPAPEVLADAVEVVSTKVPASVEETCRCD